MKNLKIFFLIFWFCVSGVFSADLKWESSATKAKVDKKLAEVEAVIQKGPFKDNWDSLKHYQIPDWYQDAKFGIFMHWGLYSVPGYDNEWYSRNMYQKDLTWDDAFKHHVATYGPQDKFGYKDFIPMFKAEKFDPEQWAQLFKAAGAKYVVPVAEHHDGFAMYDSDFSRWTTKKMGPKKDLIGLEAKAYRAEGLVFGCSSHRAEHWWFMSGGAKFPSDVQDPKYADFYGPAAEDYSNPSEDYVRNWLARSCELVDKYHPQLVYFDWWIGETPAFEPYLKKFAAYYYDRAAEWGEGVVLNTKDKAFVPGTAVQDVEKGKLPGINPVAWQTDTSVSWKSWAFLKNDQLKDAGYLIRTLIDTVSKNGNLLLDIGPASDGTIPEGQERVLREIGGWLKVNGEAIYGTRPWIRNGEGPTLEGGGKNSETDVKYQEGDVRFTRKGNVLYVLSMVAPTKPLTISSLSNYFYKDIKIQKVELLGSSEEIKWDRHDQSFVLSPPSKTGDLPIVYKVTLNGFAVGGSKIQAEGNRFTLGAVFQNYDENDIVEEVRFSVAHERVATKEVTIGAESSQSFDFSYEIPKAGIYTTSFMYAPQKLGSDTSLQCQVVLPAIDLSGEWFFQKGDDPSWSKTDLDDSSWQKVKLPAHWADIGYTCEYCYGWYRRKVFVPAEWKGHSILVPLGKIDDTDASYWNGVKIGQTGEFPPNFKGFWDKPRKYEVPEGNIRFGKDNVIAIRVYNNTGGAGLYDGPLTPIEVK